MASIKFKHPETGEWVKIGVGGVEVNTPSVETEGMQMELIWENASPTSNFTAQTIELDLNQYIALIITCRVHISAERATSHICLYGENILDLSHALNTSWVATQRHATIYPDKVVFDDGYRNGAVNNDYRIPYRIYGIKGVK